MPVIPSKYKVKGLHSSMHFSTIYNNTVRKVKVDYDKRERLELPDRDFIDIDWKYSLKETKKAIVCMHGLEGNSSSKYMLAMAKYGHEKGYDVICINFRGCSGEPNRLFRSYHAGDVDDLQLVVTHVLEQKKYNSLYIKGFSLGGNLAMLYSGMNNNIPKEVKAIMAVSSPNFLKACCAQQTKRQNILYAKNFLITMKKKLKQKQEAFPNRLTLNEIKNIKTLTDIDNIYTSKAHGFDNGMDYYEKCSSHQFMPNIKIPTLLINAQNDSFLSPKCFPVQVAKSNPNFFFESPKAGGHLGFYYGGNMTYNETRAFEFFNKN